jgi:iron(III) transport system permease protein
MRFLKVHKQRAWQFLAAGVLLLPLACAFWSSGGLIDAYTSDASATRQWGLAAAAGRSILMGVVTALLAALIGIPAAWVLAQRRNRLWPMILCALPLALPASVSVSGWVAIFAPSGFLSSLSVPIPGHDLKAHIFFSVFGAAFVLATGLWPIVALEAWPAFRHARNEGYEAALLSNGRWHAFSRVVIPQAKGELATGLLLIFLLACSDYSVSSLLLVRTLPAEIHDVLMLDKNAGAAWLALPQVIFIFFAAFMLAQWQGEAAEGSELNSAEAEQALVEKKWPWVVLGLGVLLGFALPMSACLMKAVTGLKPMSAVFSSGLGSLVVTLRLAGAAALLALLAGFLRIVAWPEKRAWPLNAAALVLLAVPGSFLAGALFNLEQKFMPAASLPHSLSAVAPATWLAFGFLIRFIYLPLRLVEEGLATLDQEMLSAAALAGHGRFARATAVALPLLLPHLFAAAALVFILSLGEVPIAARMAPPGAIPATIWLFQQQHLGYDEAVFGLSLLLGALAAGTLLLAGLFASMVKLWLRRED